MDCTLLGLLFLRMELPLVAAVRAGCGGGGDNFFLGDFKLKAIDLVSDASRSMDFVSSMTRDYGPLRGSCREASGGFAASDALL